SFCTSPCCTVEGLAAYSWAGRASAFFSTPSGTAFVVCKNVAGSSFAFWTSLEVTGRLIPATASFLSNVEEEYAGPPEVAIEARGDWVAEGCICADGGTEL